MLRSLQLITMLSVALLTTSAWAKSGSSEVLFGQRVHIAQGDMRDQDLICLACTVTVDGTMDGDLVLVGGSLDVAGAVSGDAVVFAGSAALGEHSHMGGDVVVLGGRLMRAPGATIVGDVAAPRASPAQIGGGLVIGIVAAFLIPIAVLGLLTTLLTFAVLGEQRVRAVGEAIEQHAGLALAAGIVACVAFGLIARSVHFATLDLLVLLTLCAGLVTGYAGLSLLVGQRIGRNSRALGMTMGGALVIAAIQVVPILGWMVFVFCVCIALGGCILSGFGTSPNWLEQRGRQAPPRAGATAS